MKLGITMADVWRHVGADAGDTCSHLTDDEIRRELEANSDLLDVAKHLSKRYGIRVSTADLRRRASAIRGK
jgi:hypothetical protein